jgi:hypothetical protein
MVKCAGVRLRALMVQQSARLITNRPIDKFSVGLCSWVVDLSQFFINKTFFVFPRFLVCLLELIFVIAASSYSIFRLYRFPVIVFSGYIIFRL